MPIPKNKRLPATSSSTAKTRKKDESRDNFSQSVKDILRQRAGNMCSFPGCDLSTTGPSEEKNGKATANTGEAAHITAAAAGPGARRYDEKLSKEDRASLDNGIWCCGTHARLIDRDEVTFSVSMLKHWRTVAEQRAQIAQQHGQTNALKLAVSKNGIAPDKVEFTSAANSARIDQLFSLTLISQLLPTDAWHSVRDFTFEYMDNAFRYGGAKKFEIIFHSQILTLRHDGGNFSLNELSRKGQYDGGGLFLYKELLKQTGCPPVELRAADGMRECQIRLVLTRETLLDLNPCALDIPIPLSFSTTQIDEKESAKFLAQLTSNSGCDAIFLVAYTATSITHIRDLGPRIEDALGTGKQVFVCFPNTSQSIIAEYKRRYPKIDTITWQERHKDFFDE